MHILSSTVTAKPVLTGPVVLPQKLSPAIATTEVLNLGDHFLGSTLRTAAGVATADWVTRHLYPNQSDKRKHALAGGITAGIGGGITMALTQNQWAGAVAGLALGTIAGAGKEIYDKVTGKGTPDRHDFYATVLGSAVVSVAIAIPIR